MDAAEYIKNAMRTLGGEKSEVVARFADNFDTQIYHASLVITEIAELFELAAPSAPSLDRVHFLEECGDILWYLAIADGRMGWNGRTMEYRPGTARRIDDAKLAASILARAASMTQLAGGIIDMFDKKFMFYGKPFDFEKIAALMQGINQEVGDLLVEAGFTIEQARRANIDKLRRRYAEKWTASEAMERDTAGELSAVADAIKK